jgi:cytochrome c oxidase assembly protein subunit 15
MKLFPAMVTLHLLAGLVLLALLCRQTVAYAHVQGGRAPVAIAASLRSLLFAGIALVWLQVALGGWVSTNYAVLACTDFPACQGSWWPAMDFRQGFELWRDLGKTGGGEHIGFAALTAIHYVHRLAAYLVFAVLAVLAWQLHRVSALRPQARWTAALLLWQVVTGVSNVLLGWPLLVAVAHTGGAAALVVILTWALAESRAGAAPMPTAKIDARERSA